MAPAGTRDHHGPPRPVENRHAVTGFHPADPGDGDPGIVRRPPQRRLAVGYNKAASLIERMEKEGMIGAPNHSGKRAILVGGGVDRGAYDLQGVDD